MKVHRPLSALFGWALKVCGLQFVPWLNTGPSSSLLFCTSANSHLPYSQGWAVLLCAGMESEGRTLNCEIGPRCQCTKYSKYGKAEIVQCWPVLFVFISGCISSCPVNISTSCNGVSLRHLERNQECCV